ncbi:hypothetical protein HF086_012361 [Spodoptera exigua]|uniref:Spondin domain-containing protein n=1 Tax=Spodoptera exigua TaxID=7107 RepID=A0A922SCQ5_SPOEX|nr:hypothetical protein HF086_012361 [Spodoptera exigua]
MAVARRMTAILFLLLALFDLTVGCDVDDVAVYKVSLQMLWSEERFPKDYPQNRPKAQWSQVFGELAVIDIVSTVLASKITIIVFAAHLCSLYHIGSVSSDSVRAFAQYGKIDDLVKQGDDDQQVYDQFSAPAVSLMCRMIPSPDWFIGVDGVNLCVDSSWVDQITLDVRQYSTKELNNLARTELLSTLKAKNGQNSEQLPTDQANDDNSDEEIDEEEEHPALTTRTNMDALKDLEEEPVGTPRPNVSENHVVVVTTAPTTTTTEKEFEGELKSMDDVVLAVAHGRKLGLHKHLPRHFRSRLHHAVNKIQPNDCLVSEWSPWSPCSVTCGFGEQLRYRSVVREKKDGGRDCPTLTDRKHCGNVNSCTHIDYFEW